MSKLKITDNTQTFKPTQLKAGQFYKNVSLNGGNSIYLVTESYGPVYCLTSLATGCAYNTKPEWDIADIFCGDDTDFVLIENVEVIIS
jgi:hypothetical protein